MRLKTIEYEGVAYVRISDVVKMIADAAEAVGNSDPEVSRNFLKDLAIKFATTDINWKE